MVLSNTKLFNAKPVQAFRVTMPPGKSFILPALNAPLVVVGLTGPTASGLAATGSVNDKPFTKKGDYLTAVAFNEIKLKQYQ